MSQTQLLTITGLDSAQLSVPESAKERREALAIASIEIKTVANVVQAEHAGLVLKDIASFLKLIEESRKLVKAPVVDLGRRIDALAADLTEVLSQQKDRISKLLGSYQAEENRKAEEARRKAWEEEQRIREEANRKLEDAEAHSRNQASFEKKADKIETQTAAAIVQTRAAAAAVAAPKQAGIATREVTKFEVTDIHALYAARPEFVKMEANTSAINAVLRTCPNLSIPGIRTWKEAAAIVR